MPMTVKRAQVWRAVVDHTPGQLASTLGPLAAAGADLQVVMAYRLPGEPTRAAVEVFPISGRKHAAAATGSGLMASNIPVLLVDGDNKVGVGASFASALAEAGINLTFLVAQVLGRRFMAVLGFENEADAKAAAAVLKRLGTPAKKAAKKR